MTPNKPIHGSGDARHNRNGSSIVAAPWSPPFVDAEMSTPPNEHDWHSEPWCLDAAAAYRRFHGKTLDDAGSMIAADALNRQEDLMFMPAACFRYYLPAYLSYLTSDASRGDSDGASCLFGLIDHRLDEIGVDPALLGRVAETIAWVRDRQSWYDADESVYGSFARKADRLLRKCWDCQQSRRTKP